MPPTVPTELVTALSAAGLRVAGPWRSGAAVRWTALDGEGRRWSVLTVPEQHVEHARQWARRVATINRPELGTSGPVVDLPGGGAAILVSAEQGVDLARLLAVRDHLDDAEAIAVLAPVADALAALHDAGLVRGGLTEADIVLTDGGPVLDPGQPGDGHPGEDLEALTAIGRRICVEGPSSAVAQVCAPGLSTSARELAENLRRCGQPKDIALPAPEILARLTLRGLVDADTSRVAVERNRIGGRRAHRISDPRRSRLRGPLRRSWRPVLASLAGSALIGVLIVRASLGWAATPEPVAARPGPEYVAQMRETVAERVAQRLTVQRIEAMAAGSIDELAEVTEPGSPAAVADADLILEAVDLAEISVVGEPATAHCPAHLVCIPVGYEVTTTDGRTTSAHVTLALRPGRWRVVEVLP